MGALDGLRIVEIAGLGPTPFAAMWLAEHGAEVIRVTRPGARHVLGLDRDVLDRGRDWVELDLKSDDGRAAVRALIGRADALDDPRLADWFLRLENMPVLLQWLAQAIPLTHFLVIVEGSFLKAMTFRDIFASLWPLAVIALVTLTMATVFVRGRLQ